LNLSGEEQVSFLIPCLRPDREIMTVKSQELKFRTHREGEILDLTDQIQGIVESSKLKDAVVTLFVPGSTGALTTIEYEPGLLADFPLALERLAPKEATYEHEDRWHDGNGHSHVRASMIGPDMSVPFLDKRPVPLSFLWRPVETSTRKTVSYCTKLKMN